LLEHIDEHRRSPGPTMKREGRIAQHVASTFVLVLNSWLESDTPLMPAELDWQFRALIVPTLTALFEGAR
jgi:hypothetical protein